MTTSNPFAAMLATEILPTAVGTTRVLDYYLKNENWGISQKVDGRRMIILSGGKDYQAYNRKGEKIDPKLTPELQDSLSRLGEGYLLDGEFLNDEYILFDLIQSPENLNITPNSRYKDRYDILESVVDVWEPEGVRILPFIFHEVEPVVVEDSFGSFTEVLPPKKPSVNEKLKRAYLQLLRDSHAEGAIFRAAESMYKFGVPSSGLLKYKFWNTVDCIAFNPGRQDKMSVGVAVMENGEPVDIGAVTVTERMLESIHPGQVLEVRYLYATESRRLYQPTLLRVRDDKAPEECTIDQLRYTNKKVISDQNSNHEGSS